MPESQSLRIDAVDPRFPQIITAANLSESFTVPSPHDSTNGAPASDAHLYIKHDGGQEYQTISWCYPPGGIDGVREGQTPHLQVYNFGTTCRDASYKSSAYALAERSGVKDVMVHTTQGTKWENLSHAKGAWDFTDRPLLDFTSALPTLAVLASESGTLLAFNYQPPKSEDESGSTARTTLVVGDLSPSSHVHARNAIHDFISKHWKGEHDFVVVDSPELIDESRIQADRIACTEAIIDHLLLLEQRAQRKPFLIHDMSAGERGKIRAEKRGQVEKRLSFAGQDNFRGTDVDRLLISGLTGIRRVYESADSEQALDWKSEECEMPRGDQPECVVRR